jgi:hypothetical protein
MEKSNRFQLLTILIVLTSLAGMANPHSARAQSDQQKLQQEQQAIEGTNPLMPKRIQVTFSGSGSATFTPRNLTGAMPGPTPEPNCTPAVTPVGFNVQCLSDPDTKSASTCRGSISFYSFGVTSNVVGEVTATAGDGFAMKLSSSDDTIEGCELSNVPPVSGSLGNVIAMAGCGLKINGCAGDAVGSGANHAVSSSGSVILTPSD